MTNATTTEIVIRLLSHVDDSGATSAVVCDCNNMATAPTSAAPSPMAQKIRFYHMASISIPCFVVGWGGPSRRCRAARRTIQIS